MGAVIPGKHAHPDQTAVAAALIILVDLRRKRTVPFDELRDTLRTRIAGADFLFGSALDLLFLLGLVDYRRKGDLFEYVGQ